MTDMPFLAGVMAVLCGFEALFGPQSAWMTPPAGPDMETPESSSPKRGQWYDWALLAVGMADVVTMRPAMLSFVPVVIVVAIVTAWRRGFAWRVAGVVGIVLAGIVVFFMLDPRRAAGNHFDGYEQFVLGQFRHPMGEMAAIWQNIQDTLEFVVPQALFGQHLYWVSIPVAVAILGMGLSLIAVRPLWGLWVASTIAVMLLVLPHDRYVLAVLPLLEYSWWRIVCWLNRKLPAPWGNSVAAVLLLWQVIFNLGPVGGFMIEQRWMPFLAHYRKGQYLTLANMGQIIHDQVPPDAWVLAPAKTARVLSWYSGRRVVEQADYPAIDLARQDLFLVIDPKDTTSKAWEVQTATDNHFTVLRSPDNPRADRPAPDPPLRLRHCVPAPAGN
jgi:hypothetical protein